MTLMFDKSQVEEATHPLVRILRHIFYKRRITLDDFSTMYARHGKNLGLAAHMTNTNRNNARKALNHPDKITFVLFNYIMHNILREDVVDHGITIREKDGTLATYKWTDPIDTITVQNKVTKKRITYTGEFSPINLPEIGRGHEFENVD